ncbi:unnamed protein product [Periconia digitata]|uniref:Uncharacterized protein n=1 Tax=Periconia digitata TaxID=1303443 RepID=A0A9W4UE00_9PLEO|nr:unnamed protein product [Periconia digitata]
MCKSPRMHPPHPLTPFHSCPPTHTYIEQNQQTTLFPMRHHPLFLRGKHRVH